MGNSQSSGGGGGSGQKMNFNTGFKGRTDMTIRDISKQTSSAENSIKPNNEGTFPNTNSHSTGSSNWNNSTSNSGYSGGTSYSSQEQHIQSVNTALGGNVLGGAYHDGRKNRDIDDGINYQVKGIVQNLNYYGFKDPKGIVLSDCALEDKDIGVLVKSLQPHQFNLIILDLGSNKLGYYSIENIFYGMRGSQEGVTTHVCKQIRSINFSNNLLDDNSANYIAKSLEYGRFPSLKYLDVSGNQITKTGESYFVKALDNPHVQNMVITIKSFFTASRKDYYAPILKEALKYAQSNGIDISKIAVDKSFIASAIDGVKMGFNLSVNFLKCKIVPIFEAPSLASDAFTLVYPKHPVTFVLNTSDNVVCSISALKEEFNTELGARIAIRDLELMGESDFVNTLE